ncbi:MAG: response regulator transcription factor, partial [Oscillospiraceae bacterium]|nr:response regulator transcription factor [Oscillospiraceae bacterium]
MKILIVEDDMSISRFLSLELKHEEYETDTAADGRTALDKINVNEYDAIILDIMLPGLNGLEVLRRMRKEGNNTPVIMLTARDSVMDKVSGLDMGANDYLTKPFAIEELLARLRAVMRVPRVQTNESDLISYKGLVLDKSRHTVTVDGEPIDLTVKEYGLLQTLLENQSVVLSREQLLEQVWGYD